MILFEGMQYRELLIWADPKRSKKNEDARVRQMQIHETTHSSIKNRLRRELQVQRIQIVAGKQLMNGLTSPKK
jgi:hypothetical protein